MPSCIVPGCHNNTGKPTTEPKSYHQVPDPQKNYPLCERWLNNISNPKYNINKLVASRSRLVCSDHFHSNCFVRDLKLELLDKDQFPLRKKPNTILVEGSIPTIFKNKIFEEININGTKALPKVTGSF